MKSKAVVGSAIIWFVCCAMARAQWPQQTYACRNWEIEAGTRILDRPGSDQNLTLVTERTTLAPLFTAQQATELSTSAGADIRILRHSPYGNEWEFRSFFNHWENFQTITGNLNSPFVPLLPISNIDYGYQSDHYSFELNYKRAFLPGLTAFIGGRYVQLEDQLQIDSSLQNGSGAVLQTNTLTRNPMWGAQLGLEFRKPITRTFWVLGSIKAGGYVNNALNSTVTQTLIGNTPVLTNNVVDERKSTGAFIGEVAARFHYDIAPGQVSLYAGYEANWLDGVAVAPPQVFNTLVPAQSSIHTSSTVFMHGVVLGGTVRF